MTEKEFHRKLPHNIRIRHTDLITNPQKTLPGSVIFAHLAVGESHVQLGIALVEKLAPL